MKIVYLTNSGAVIHVDSDSPAQAEGLKQALAAFGGTLVRTELYVDGATA